MLEEKQGERRRCNWERSQPATMEICLAENRRFRLDSQSPKKNLLYMSKRKMKAHSDSRALTLTHSFSRDGDG